MSNVNLLNLQNAINTNTLSLAQQAALSNALAEIIPTFPSPDEISNSIPFDEEALARDWMAALYAVAIAGGSSGVIPVTNGTILAPTAANLEATSTTGLSNGQPAIVETFGAEFTLQPIGDMTVDGVTVLSSTDPTRVWERGDTVIAVQAALQTSWHVNPATGNDENTGLSTGQALATKAEIMRRWGSWSPTLDGVHVVVTQDFGDGSGSTDPWLGAPNFVNGATLLYTAALPAPAFTGTLDVVAAKNRPANTALQSSFTTATGGINANMMLVNATRGGSVAFVQRNLGAGNWQLSQPLTPYVPTGFSSVTAVDSWASGDAITGYNLVTANIARLGGQSVDYQPAFAGASCVVQHVQILDPEGGGAFDPLQVTGEIAVIIAESAIQRSLDWELGQTLVTGLVNVANFGAITLLAGGSPGPNTGGPIVTGGFSSNLFLSAENASFQLDTIIDAPGLLALVTHQCEFLNVFYDTNTTNQCSGNCSMTGVQYGPGGINLREGLIAYSNGSAVNSFPLGLGIKLDGGTVAYSSSTGAGNVVTAHGQVPLTPANLDAAAGAAGFGNLAYIPGVGSFQQIGTPLP